MPAYQAIILAAGQGRRMKAGKNKQFIHIGDVPMIKHTLQVFEDDDWCKAIYIVIHPNEESEMKQIIKEANFSKVKKLVYGGKERQDSVANGVYALEEELITFVHDGARPFVSQEELHELYLETERNGAAFLAVPVTDTIKRVVDGKVETLKRDELFAAQTPQTFTYELIKKAHKYALENNIIATDDVALLECIGFQPTIVQGSYRNFKITNPEDIQKAENMLKIKKVSR